MAPDNALPVPADPDALAALAEAGRVLAAHVDADGHCRGCITERARLVPFPCRQALSARLVIDRHGAPKAGLPGEEP